MEAVEASSLFLNFLITHIEICVIFLFLPSLPRPAFSFWG